jgi:tubulin polyglutamylase TTLL5
MWTWSRPRANMVDSSLLLSWQKINHFAGAIQLTRKDLLKKHIDKYAKLKGYKWSSQFRILPETFVLPNEWPAFLDAFGRKPSGAGVAINTGSGVIDDVVTNDDGDGDGDDNDNNGDMMPPTLQSSNIGMEGKIWIMKPVSSSRGRGISLVDSLSEIRANPLSVAPSHVPLSHAVPSLVVQRYIMRPLLVEGHKFDLRLYVVVTHINPLEVYLYREGFARFSKFPFSSSTSTLSDRFIHLTNSSVQKDHPSALPFRDDQADGDSKISLASLKRRLASVGIDWQLTIWPAIQSCMTYFILSICIGPCFVLFWLLHASCCVWNRYITCASMC